MTEEQQKQMTTAAQLLEAAKHLRALAFRHPTTQQNTSGKLTKSSSKAANR
jgi:hypothetical protein